MGDFIKTTPHTANRNDDGSWTVTNDHTGKSEQVSHETFLEGYQLTPQQKGTPYSSGKAAYIRAKKNLPDPAPKAEKTPKKEKAAAK